MEGICRGLSSYCFEEESQMWLALSRIDLSTLVIVLVGVEEYVAVSVGGLLVHTNAKFGVTPSHMDSEEC